jgi:hypothetical protein
MVETEADIWVLKERTEIRYGQEMGPKSGAKPVL